jgi:hypothetical protein
MKARAPMPLRTTSTLSLKILSFLPEQMAFERAVKVVDAHF